MKTETSNLKETANDGNTLLPAVGERIRFRKSIEVEGEVFKITDSFGKTVIIVNADTCKIVDSKFTAYGLREGEFTNCR